MATTWEQHLNVLQSAIKARPPFCSGVVPLDKPQTTLWYTKPDGLSGVVNFAEASPSQLDELVQACAPVTFGRAQENVYDETYRKAWKLDAENFSMKFDPVASGIIATIREQLLEGRNNDRSIKAECYKLNVYSEGSFFKAHKDTPRGTNMFGSLVVVLPTTHEGGSLVLRHGGKEWVFDYAKILPEQSSPSIGFIAYFSDVEHEVLPVTSGHRVTLTYNLYFKHKSDRVPITKDVPDFPNLKEALRRLIDDETFLPEGGTGDNLGNLLGSLKGTDATLKDVCEAVDLEVSLQVFVEAMPRLQSDYDEGMVMMLPKPYDFSNTYSEYGLREFLDASGGKVVYRELPGVPRERPGNVVVFATEAGFTPYESSYLAFGNEPSAGYLYGHIYLVVEVAAR